MVFNGVSIIHGNPSWSKLVVAHATCISRQVDKPIEKYGQGLRDQGRLKWPMNKVKRLTSQIAAAGSTTCSILANHP